MEAKKGQQHKPLKMIAKFFNKGKRTSSVPEVNVNPKSENLDSELEALHLSRTDNPYLQVLSSQDNLDQMSTPMVSTPLCQQNTPILEGNYDKSSTNLAENRYETFIFC